MKVSLFIGFSLITLSAWSQPLPETKTTTVIQERDATSSEARFNKNYQVDALLLGLGPSAVSSTGISLGHFFDPESMLLIEATNGRNASHDRPGYGASSDFRLSSHEEVNAYSLGVHYKKFTGNSFYFRGGIDYRYVDYEYGSSYYGALEKASFNGDSWTFNFQIGNQWQWDNFTLGCDWVGVSIPLAYNIKDKSMNAGASAADAYGYDKLLNEKTNLYVKAMNINLLRFYIGASF